MENFDLDLKKNDDEQSTLNYSLIIALIIGLLLIGGVAYWYFTRENKGEEATTDNQEQTIEEGNASDENSTEKVIDSTELQQDNTYESEVDQATENTTENNEDNQNELQNETTGSSSQNNETASVSDNIYFIVNGAFRNEDNAQNKLQDLKGQGFEAVIVGPTANGLYIVAYEGFSNIEDAKTKLKEIRQSHSQAWIYKKK